MHPAISIIFFTTATGAGYGLLGFCGMLAAFGALPNDRMLAIATCAIFFGLIAGGLLSSTAHLGHPERAWRAFSQWRSSWLSREGVAAVVTFIPALGFAALWVFAGGAQPRLMAACGLAAAAMSVVTVLCTAMIYASLKPIHQWHHGLVLPVYLALAAMTGSVLLNAFMLSFGHRSLAVAVAALGSILLSWALKEAYWHVIRTTAGPSTPGTAIGLPQYGAVRMLDAPHTEENYLLREMGFHIGRKHAKKLRMISRLTGFVVPLALTAVTVFSRGHIAAIAAVVAVVSMIVGILVERWLFFAEAKHTVTLYYGAASA